MEKILIFIDNLSSGGKERRLSYLLSFLQSTNFEIHLLMTDDIVFYSEVRSYKLKIHIIEGLYSKRLFFLKRYYRLLKEFNPSIVHAWGQTSVLYSVFMKFIFGFKLINSKISECPEILGISLTDKIINKLGFKFSDIIIANTKKGLQYFKTPSIKSIVIRNGFDFAPIDKKTSIKKTDFFKEDSIVVGMTATFSDNKDWDTFLNAAKTLIAKDKKFCFLCIGDGKYFDKYKTIYSQKNIIFTGRIQNVIDYIKIMNIGVLCTFGEGMSNSIIEMMACKLPVIATDAGAMSELIKDGFNGLLIPLKSSEELVKKILLLSDDIKLKKGIALNAQNYVKDELKLERMFKEYYDLYNTLLINTG